MMKQSLSLLLATAVALPLSAAVIVETEANGTAANNSLVSAQSIPFSAFTSPNPPNVANPPGSITATIQGRGGGDDVDYYSFHNPHPGMLLYLDVDNSPATFDNMVAVFNSTGTLMAWGDDTTPVDPGSASSIDARLGPLVLSTVGTYYIAISEFPNYPQAALLFSETALAMGGVAVTGATAGLSSFDFNGPQPNDSLPYTLQVTLVTPEPSTFALLGGALLALAALRRRN
jgi:hypothetical protein